MLKIHFSAVLVCFFFSEARTAGVLFANKNGGFVTSPSHPLFYDPNIIHRQLVRGRRSDIVTLKFTNFRTEGLDNANNRTDYLRILDGRSSIKPKPQYLFGNLPTPFLVISTTRRLRLKFVSNDNNVAYQGYEAEYKFHPAKTSCNATNLKGNGYLIRSCNSIAAEATSQCTVQCRENYQLLSTSVSTCVDGSFSKVDCSLIESIVSRCEDNDLVGCPYTAEEIFDFYDNVRLPQDEDLTEEESLEEEQNIKTIEIAVGRVPGCRVFCVRSSSRSYVRPDKCGRMSTKNSRKRCIRCRYYPNNCSSASFLGG